MVPISAQVSAVVAQIQPPNESPAARETHPVEEAGKDDIIQPVETTEPTLVLSAGAEPAQSWVSRNKYILGVLVTIAVIMASLALLGRL